MARRTFTKAALSEPKIKVKSSNIHGHHDNPAITGRGRTAAQEIFLRQIRHHRAAARALSGRSPLCRRRLRRPLLRIDCLDLDRRRRIAGQVGQPGSQGRLRNTRGHRRATGYAYTDDLSPSACCAPRDRGPHRQRPGQAACARLYGDARLSSLYPMPRRRLDSDSRPSSIWSCAPTAPRAPTIPGSPRCAPATPTNCDGFLSPPLTAPSRRLATPGPPERFCLAKDGERSTARNCRRRRPRRDRLLSEEKTPEHFAQEAARQAILQLYAVAAPAGEWRSSSVPDGPACCCMKPSVTDSKPTLTAEDLGLRRPDRPGWPAPRSPSSTTAPCPPARLAQCRRRRLAYTGNGPDRERNS